MEDLERFLAKRLRVDRLRDILAAMGKEAPAARNKDPLVALVAEVGRAAPKNFLESLFRDELSELARILGATPIARRHQDYVVAVLGAWDGPPTDRAPELVTRPAWQNDPGRRDLSSVGRDRGYGFGELRIVPTRPSHQDQVSLFDFFRRLRDPSLRMGGGLASAAATRFVAAFVTSPRRGRGGRFRRSRQPRTPGCTAECIASPRS